MYCRFNDDLCKAEDKEKIVSVLTVFHDPYSSG